MSQLEHGLYPFSETNLENFSRTLIDFSRSPDFTFNTFMPKISKSILPVGILKTLLLELSRFFFSRKCQNKIPGHSRLRRTYTIPEESEKVVFRYKRQKDWRWYYIIQANSLQQVVFILLLTLTDKYP